MTFVRAIRASFIFLTRIPVGGFPYTREEWRWACAHFPLVGLVLGALHGLIFWALLPLSPLAAASIMLGISTLLTGAFHEDGLADTSDALGGAFDREKLQLILKDSRVGTYGAVAVCFSLGTRAALWTATQHGYSGWQLVAVSAFASCASRTFPVLQMSVMPYATEQGAKSRDVARAGVPQVLIAIVYPVVFALIACNTLGVAWMRLAAGAGVGLALTLLTAYRYHVRLGGLAGDFLGATQQLCEIGIWCALAWAVPHA
jgi:adenosylcobinamide-GDP ribazoletransferase